jgi:hypothetical protein
MPRRLLLGAGAAVCLAAASAIAVWMATKKDHLNRDEPLSETWAADAVYLFHDRHDAVLEHLFAFRDEEAVVQVAVFPDYAEPRWYHCQKLPPELLQRVRTWAARPGDIKPPFEPHGPWFSRITYTPDRTRERGEGWFRNDNREVERWFATLRQALVREEYRVEALPLWVKEDEQVRKHFGLWD